MDGLRKRNPWVLIFLPPLPQINFSINNEEHITGITTFPAGLNKDGSKNSSYQESIPICSKLLVLADGSRGHLSQAWRNWKGIRSPYAQTYALGVKELWEIPSDQMPQTVIHTMGWPLPMDCFGGSWLYPMGSNTVSLGLVAGLNSPFKNLDIHLKLQEMKNHSLFKSILQNGKCLEWGAKTIPEGGYYSLPDPLHDHGLLVLGDAAGMVNVPALKGIHYAMTAGLLAAETAYSCLKKKDFSKNSLKEYDHKVRHTSCIGKELYPVRNIRQAFDKNIFTGLLKSGLMFLTKGLFPGDNKKKNNKTDAEYIRYKKIKYMDLQKAVIKPIRKTEAVFLSGNKTRDTLPSHLKVKEDLPKELQDFYTHLCPAGVYEKTERGFVINAPNCIDCKATDILGPRWTPKEGGTGPNYQQM